MIALRAPTCLSLGIATLLATGIWLARPTPTAASAPNISPPTPGEQLGMRWRHQERTCDLDDVTSVVIRGQFASHEPLKEGFTISFAGSSGQYTAMTDSRGYFEVRMPREDFDGDLCELPLHHRHFTDEQLSLTYNIDLER